LSSAPFSNGSRRSPPWWNLLFIIPCADLGLFVATFRSLLFPPHPLRGFLFFGNGELAAFLHVCFLPIFCTLSPPHFFYQVGGLLGSGFGKPQFSERRLFFSNGPGRSFQRTVFFFFRGLSPFFAPMMMTGKEEEARKSSPRAAEALLHEC